MLYNCKLFDTPSGSQLISLTVFTKSFRSPIFLTIGLRSPVFYKFLLFINFKQTLVGGVRISCSPCGGEVSLSGILRILLPRDVGP